MTPEQISSIISAMPEGKRKRACVMVLRQSYSALSLAAFWAYIESSNWSAAAKYLLGDENDPDYQERNSMLADMIWEGGA